MRKRTNSILQSALIQGKHGIVPYPVREMDVLGEEQVKWNN